MAATKLAERVVRAKEWPSFGGTCLKKELCQTSTDSCLRSRPTPWLEAEADSCLHTNSCRLMLLLIRRRQAHRPVLPVLEHAGFFQDCIQDCTTGELRLRCNFLTPSQPSCQWKSRRTSRRRISGDPFFVAFFLGPF